VIVARACGRDLESLAQQYLLSPMKARVVKWNADADGYNWGWGEIYVTARDMAKFGLLYMGGGQYQGKRILPAEWVRDSPTPSTQDPQAGRVAH
jgi:CubicO group peptidase (beta-lactamase class C family)